MTTPTIDLRKAFRRAVRERIWPVLRLHGFTEFADLAAWSRAVKWIDCVQLQTIPPTRFGLASHLGWDERGNEVYATEATFQLLVGTYYLDVHLLPWMSPAPARPSFPRGESSRGSICHRAISLARSKRMGRIQGTIFRVAPNGSNLDAVVDEALKALEERGLPWLATTHDIAAYLDGNLEELHPKDHSLQWDLTSDERQEVEAWSNSAGGYLLMSQLPLGLSEGLRAKFQEASEQMNLRDHVAYDVPPDGDVLYGLLIGQGRWDEAIAALRASSTSHPLTDREGELDKRTLTTFRKAEEGFQRVEREHLQALEQLRAIRTKVKLPDR